jgi:hypothetical protein
MSNADLQQLGRHAAKHTAGEATVIGDLAAAFEGSRLPAYHRIEAFPRHVRRQDVARFLAKYELFKLALPVHGNVVECGVWAGGGLSSWLHFSSILEPYNHTRRVIGFDTFSGFPSVHESDTNTGSSEHLSAGAFRTHESMEQELRHLVAIHDRNRPLGHIPKVELVVGDAMQTIPRYVADKPHTLISLMYLDFDLYEPTKAAMEHLYPRAVKGAVIAFDELNCPEFPGETLALVEALGLDRVELRRLPFDPYISYFIKG